MLARNPKANRVRTRLACEFRPAGGDTDLQAAWSPSAAGEGIKHYQVLFILNFLPDWDIPEPGKKDNPELRNKLGAKVEKVTATVADPAALRCVCWRECGPFKPLEPLMPAPRVLVEKDQIR